MIFEESEHTAIDLDAQVRGDVLDGLDAIDNEAWESDEALGWVYQYFGEEEREDIDDRVDEENYKIAGTDIATKTQLFTPRYIVEWMVDNSLGRTWLEMCGDRTDIDDEENCFYLAPLEDSLLDRETKAVEDITVLDPACGSGHMLFYAFDVLYQMYLEEGEIPEEYIPREILQNNLYGIDIDSGAAQIAALSLYLKAKETSPEVTIPQLNIVSADAVLINGGKKREIINQARSGLEEEILEQIWRSFDNIREFGSLVQVEERIDEILEDHRNAIQAAEQVKFSEDGSFATQDSFVSDEGGKESWEKVKNRLLNQVSDIASEALDRDDPIEEMFAQEVGKTVELLDLLVHEYDVTITNPPYLSSSKMGSELNNLLKDRFVGNINLYSAFIERMWDFTNENGYSSAVTPESYMFIPSFSELREIILNEKTLTEGLHLGGYSFSNKDRPFTIPTVIRNSNPSSEFESRFHRLTHEQEGYNSHEKKIQGVNEITRHARSEITHPDTYIIRQDILGEIRRTPFVYWFGPELLEMFEEYPYLGDLSEISGGVQTGDNTHFLRKFWEVRRDSIGEQYRWYVKNGDYVEYFDKIDTVVEWENNGQNIVNYAAREGKHCQGLSNIDWYFDESIIYRDFSKLFVAKLIPAGCIFSNSVYRVKPQEDISRNHLLAYMNSSLYRYLASGINPTLHYKPGDAGAVPIKRSLNNKEEIEKHVSNAVEKRQNYFSLIEESNSFSEENFQSSFAGGIDDFLLRNDTHLAECGIIRGLLDELIFGEYSISQSTRKQIRQSQTQNLARLPHYINENTSLNQKFEYLKHVPTSDDEDLSQELIDSVSKSTGDVLELADENGVSPYTIVNIRAEGDLYSSDERSAAAGRLISYLIGSLFGRWTGTNGQNITTQEILMFGASHSEGIRDQLIKCASELLPQEANQIESELNKNLGMDYDEWLKNNFFQDHHCSDYRRRGQRIPIYWQLESPNRAFSCYIYYHNIDQNTLPKLRGQYIDPRIEELENELETLNAQTKDSDPDKELLKRKEKLQNDLDDVREFRDTIDEMIDDGVTVDVENGIWENIKEWDRYEVFETGLPKLKSSYSR